MLNGCSADTALCKTVHARDMQLTQQSGAEGSPYYCAMSCIMKLALLTSS